MNGLEALEVIWKNEPRVCASCGYTSCKDCKKVLAKAQIEEELKALEIIKNKSVYLTRLHYARDMDYYNSIYNERFRLTQDEFDLLKKVLG